MEPGAQQRIWQKLGDNSVVKAVTVVGIALAGLWVISKWDTRGMARSGAPQVVRSVEGVTLGEKLSAVSSTYGSFEKEKRDPQVVKKHQDEDDYQQKDGQLRLAVRNGVITTVSYACRPGRDRVMVNYVACHDFEDKIRTVFGERIRVLCAKVRPGDANRDIAPHVRAYDAVEYGTRYIVIKDVVQGFMVMDAKELESLVGLNWVKCG